MKTVLWFSNFPRQLKQEHQRVNVNLFLLIKLLIFIDLLLF
jgi:hypothetical protein